MRGRRRGPPYPRVPFAGDSDAGCRSVGFVSGAARLRRNNLSGHRARGHFALRSEPIDADQALVGHIPDADDAHRINETCPRLFKNDAPEE